MSAARNNQSKAELGLTVIGVDPCNTVRANQNRGYHVPEPRRADISRLLGQSACPFSAAVCRWERTVRMYMTP